MNIYDISQKAGVSIATVSRVLNGSEKVSEKNHEKRYLLLWKKTAIPPNAFARSLGLNSMHTVGILCSDSSDVYQAQAIYYLERELRKNSYASMLCCTGYELSEKQSYLNLLLSRNVDAVLLIGSHFIENSPEENRYILDAASKTPVLILNGELKGDNIYSILCDDYMALKDMTDLVFSNGAKSPIYLYRTLNYSGQKKAQGFLNSCAKHGIDSSKNTLFAAPEGLHKACAVLEQLDAKGISFDCVLAADDELAAGAVKICTEKTTANPGRFSDNRIQQSPYLLPAVHRKLTTIDNRVEYMCVTAVSQMMQVFQKEFPPSRTMFSGSIIKKQTTK